MTAEDGDGLLRNTVAARSFSDARRILASLEPTLDPAAPPWSMGDVSDAAVAPEAAAALADFYPSSARPDGPLRPIPTHPRFASMPSLADGVRAIASGESSARALVETALENMDATAELGAMAFVDPEVVLKEADLLDSEAAAGRSRGPLHGLPITVKDVIHVEGMPTKAGSDAYASFDHGEGLAVTRLRRAGALILGKATTHEFALGVTTPQCRNPHDPRRLAGGSSGGSAVGVATGVGIASLATDTRASLRVPAALCGVVSFKPSLGAVPTDGIVPLSWSMDHIGPIARSVLDAAALLDVLAGRPLASPMPGGERAGCRTPVVGVIPSILEAADPTIAEAVEAVLSLLAAEGCRVVDAPGPSTEDLDIANALGLLISRGEAATFHRSTHTDLARCIPEVREQLLAAQDVGAMDYLAAQRHRRSLAARTFAAMSGIDFLVVPTTPVVAPRHDDYEDYLLILSRNAIIWSLVGCPVLALPVGATPDGLPIGLQLTSAPGRESLLARMGVQIERALGANR